MLNEDGQRLWYFYAPEVGLILQPRTLHKRATTQMQPKSSFPEFGQVTRTSSTHLLVFFLL
jgi:hypothetical protein